jgi:hypothetical protein
MPDVRIRVIELMDYVLSTYDRKIGEFTARQFERAGNAGTDGLPDDVVYMMANHQWGRQHEGVT